MNPNPCRLSRGGDRNQPGNAKRGTIAHVGKWFWSDYNGFITSLRANGNPRMAPLIAGSGGYRRATVQLSRVIINFRVAAPASKSGDQVLARLANHLS
jgi:hypothetical protein